MAIRHEISSGGIVYKVTKRGVHVAFVRDSVGKMTFPKGHVEHGESIEKTARREILEETGLRGLRLVRKLGKIKIEFEDRYVKKGDTIKKDIHYFLFEAPEHARFKRMKKPKGGGEMIRGLKWVSLTDTGQWSEYQDMEIIVEKAVALIAKQVRRRNKRNPYATKDR
ncbi:NUDIX domain-containing protein [Candidatus Uhrbacteria bacterium]|jgi:8-oxo-dGTP pyrophosphatase MutT (NUDIX family)|nr:NUDIX domain-containing protein [Candidatus Uhrbacteria bacterium]HJN85345.1 NUDIX domain-containing protein [Patescibacteria group bacterium]